MPKLTGGFVNYYLVKVNQPQRTEQPPYQAECEDIIQALGMDFNEGCLFKALWRSANARKGNGKPDNKATYDAEKMVHYAKRILKALQAMRDPEGIIPNGGDWIELLPGDSRGVDIQTVDVLCQDGRIALSQLACNLNWRSGMGPGTIIAYRPAK